MGRRAGIVVPRAPPPHQQDRHDDPDDDCEHNALGVSSQGERDYQQRNADQQAWVQAGGLADDPDLHHLLHARQDTAVGEYLLGSGADLKVLLVWATT